MSAAPDRARLFEAPGDVDDVNRLFRERRWGDGLPVIPPTEARVARLLAGTRRGRHDVVARVAPGYGAATVERIAINAVLTGCEPEHLPVLIAAIEAMCAPEFNLQGIQATTNPVAVWMIVNGPAVGRLGINSGMNCLGQGTFANAVLGRALRLVLQNIGRAFPGEMDRATHGQPGKFSFCCGENEAESPWEPLHVERGYARGDSTVTVMGAEGTVNMNTHTKEADDLLRVVADTFAHGPSNDYWHGGTPWVIFGPEHAAVLGAAGLSKADVKRELWERSKMPAHRMAAKDYERMLQARGEELGTITPDTLLPTSIRPEDIGIIVAGGPGTHSVYVPSFGNTVAVTRRIEGDA